MKFMIQTIGTVTDQGQNHHDWQCKEYWSECVLLFLPIPLHNIIYYD
jgi:hypothetical protein